MKIFREKHSFSTINCIGVKYCRWCLAVWKIPLYSQFVDLSWYYSTLLNFSDHYIDFFSFFISFICFYFTSTPIFFCIGFSFLHFILDTLIRLRPFFLSDIGDPMLLLLCIKFIPLCDVLCSFNHKYFVILSFLCIHFEFNFIFCLGMDPLGIV